MPSPTGAAGFEGPVGPNSGIPVAFLVPFSDGRGSLGLTEAATHTKLEVQAPGRQEHHLSLLEMHVLRPGLRARCTGN